LQHGLTIESLKYWYHHFILHCRDRRLLRKASSSETMRTSRQHYVRVTSFWRKRIHKLTLWLKWSVWAENNCGIQPDVKV